MTPEQVCSLTELCLKSTYFRHGDQFFEQTAMGSTLSPVVAGLFMEDFEQTALMTADRQPKLWLRYVGDTFIVWPHGRTQLDAFLEHFNSLCQKIHFLMEMEEKNQLSCLDVLVQRNEDSLTTSVYRKKTRIDRYLHFRRHHHPQVKVGVICLKRRAEQVGTMAYQRNCNTWPLPSKPMEAKSLMESSRSIEAPRQKVMNRWGWFFLTLRDSVRRHAWPLAHSMFDCVQIHLLCQDPNTPWWKEGDGVPDSLWVWLSVHWRDRKAAKDLHCKPTPTMPLHPMYGTQTIPSSGVRHQCLSKRQIGTEGGSRRHFASEALPTPWTQTLA